MDLPIPALIFICFIVLGVIAALIYRRTFRIIAEISQKYESIEKLLLDIRDDTRNFYKEKRRFSRVRDGIGAKIVNREGSSELFKVLDISYEGAHLRTAQPLKPQETIELDIYLPLFPQPINVKAKVVRVFPAKLPGQPEIFDAGVQFLQISRLDKERLTETVDVLEKHLPE